MNENAAISCRAYAKLRGVSAMAVSRAISKKQLVASVIWVNGKPKITDPALADQEWAANVDHSKAPGYVKEREDARRAAASSPPAASEPAPVEVQAPNGERIQVPAAEVKQIAAGQGSLFMGMSLTDASAAEKVIKAKRAELLLRRDLGELVEVAKIAADLGKTLNLVRTRLLGVPSRVRQQCPDLTPQQHGAIDRTIREALEELARLGEDARNETDELEQHDLVDADEPAAAVG